MTPEQQRIAIAKACGAHIYHVEGSWTADYPLGLFIILDQFGNVLYSSAPDYLNDLNAVHEAEATLSNAMQDRYYAELSRKGTWFQCLHATAAQRAEAFLKTLNLWKE